MHVERHASYPRVWFCHFRREPKSRDEMSSQCLAQKCCTHEERIQAIVQNYPEGSQVSAISMAMDIVQRQIGWIPISAMHKVAELLSMPRMRVYEWATFYTMCKRTYRGKFNVKVCKTLPCMLRGSDIILQAVVDATGCPVGGLSEDRMFGVDLVECQGACANAPVVVIDDDYYGQAGESVRLLLTKNPPVPSPALCRGRGASLRLPRNPG
ncbi:unnamed protein product [Spodoptera exigua]|nr:unnamed protein product [Spodoptera exigua]